MPPLESLSVPMITRTRKWCLAGLRGYLVIVLADGVVKIILLAVH